MKKSELRKLINEELKSILNESVTPYVKNIDEDTLNNDFYRKVVFTGKKLQLVLMAIPVGQEIGEETHDNGDQFIRIEQGTGIVKIDNNQYEIKSDFGITIPAGSLHNIINTGNTPLKLYSIYTPPEHPSNTIQKQNPLKI